MLCVFSEINKMGGVAEMAGAPTAENSIPTPPSSNRNLQSIHAASSSPDQKKNWKKYYGHKLSFKYKF